MIYLCSIIKHTKVSWGIWLFYGSAQLFIFNSYLLLSFRRRDILYSEQTMWCEQKRTYFLHSLNAKCHKTRMKGPAKCWLYGNMYYGSSVCAIIPNLSTGKQFLHIQWWMKCSLLTAHWSVQSTHQLKHGYRQERQ